MTRLDEAHVLTDPAALRRPHDIAVRGDLALVPGKGATLAALDVRDPARPRVFDFLHDDRALEDAQTVLPGTDGTWWVGARDLHRAHLTPDGRLQLDATLSDRARLDRVNGMACVGPHMVAACKHGHLTLLQPKPDLKPEPKPGPGSATSPEIRGHRNTAAKGELRSPHDVAVTADRTSDPLVVTVDGAGRDPMHHVAIYRATDDDPRTWPCAGLIADDRLHGANRVRAAHGHAYIACYGHSNIATVRLPAGLPGRLCESDHPAELVHVADFEGREPTGMWLGGRLLAIAGGQSVQLFDLANPARPEPVASVTSPRLFPAGGDSAHDLVYHRGHLLVTAQNDTAIVIYRLDEGLIRLAEMPS